MEQTASGNTHATDVAVFQSGTPTLTKKEGHPQGMSFFFLVEAAGKQVIKQLITVFHDAPEDFKELKERRLAERRIMTIKSSRRRTFRFESRKLKIRLPSRDNLILWSKRRDSNPRSPVPEQIRHRFLTTFVDFWVLFSLKTMLSRALIRTVSTQSKSVDGQRCGHRANFARLKVRKLNRIYPVLNFVLCR